MTESRSRYLAFRTALGAVATPRARWLALGTAAGLSLAACFAQDPAQAGTLGRFFSIQLFSAWLALGAGLLVLVAGVAGDGDRVRARIRRSRLIAAALIGAGLGDFMIALFAAGFIWEPAADPDRFLPAAWIAVRAAFAALILAGARQGARPSADGDSGAGIPADQLRAGSHQFFWHRALWFALLAPAAVFVLAAVPLPPLSHAFVPVLHRPFEIPVALLCLAAFGILARRRGDDETARTDAAQVSAIGALIGAVAAHLAAVQSLQPFDGPWGIAQSAVAAGHLAAAAAAMSLISGRSHKTLRVRTVVSFAWMAMIFLGAVFASASNFVKVQTSSTAASRYQTSLSDARALVRLDGSIDQTMDLAMAGSAQSLEALHQMFTQEIALRLESLMLAGLPEALHLGTEEASGAARARATMETRMLNLASAGRIDEATALRDAPTYSKWREQFTAQSGRLNERLEALASDATRSTSTAARTAFGLLLAATIFGALCAWIFSRRLRADVDGPVARLSEMTDAVLRGQKAEHVPLEGPEELAGLAGRMNAMLDRFSEHEDALERNTRELLTVCETAEGLSRMKGEVLSRLAQQIRSPLNGVVGMAELLAGTELDNEQNEYVSDLRRSTAHVLSILNDIQDFSRLESEHMKIERMDFNLRSLVYDLCERMRDRSEDKGLQFTAFIEDEVPSLLTGDPGRLRQVLHCLLDNAVRYTMAGEVSIRIGLESESSAAVQIRFTVEDTGCGIDEATRHAMLDEDASDHLSVRRPCSSSGLGLTISRQLVGLMKGSLKVVSHTGRGSSFSFMIPLGTKRASESPRGSVSADGREPARPFVVASNSHRRLRIRELLGELGYEAKVFSNCDEAFENFKMMDALAAQEAKGDQNGRQNGHQNAPFYTLGFIDEFGSEDGMSSFFEAVGQIDAMTKLPLILLVVSGRRGDAELARGLGCAGYLSGELTAGLLSSVISRVVSMPPQSEAGDTSEFITRHSLAELRRASARVLIAEDDHVNQRVLLAILRKAGYRAEAVDNGNAAITAVETRNYDLVLMDCEMPKLDGMKATAVIRRLEGDGERMPIVALTGLTGPGVREQCLVAGMDDYMAKPVIAQKLLAAVDRWILSAPELKADLGTALENGSDSAPERIDLAGLRQKALGDTKAEEFLIRQFIDETHKHLGAARRGVHARRSGMVERASGQLKSASSDVGAPQLFEIFEELETLACQGNLSAADALIAEAEAEFVRTTEYLSTHYDWVQKAA